MNYTDIIIRPLLREKVSRLSETNKQYAFHVATNSNKLQIKNAVEEKFSVKVKKRIDSISPLHATRMGPAIRHATYKLDQVDARTKLLFLISDGRPQDRGYSREGVEKEYAVHDTKKALDEAKNRSINAFCLTVDKNGHDYLKTMCEDVGYEILDDINSLPKRLLYLYKRLTM